MFMERKLHQKKEEVLEALTLCSPLNKTLVKMESMKLSINEITRPKDILSSSGIMNLSHVLQGVEISMNYGLYDESEGGSVDFNGDSPMHKTKTGISREKDPGNNMKSMYFTYENQLEFNFNNR